MTTLTTEAKCVLLIGCMFLGHHLWLTTKEANEIPLLLSRSSGTMDTFASQAFHSLQQMPVEVRTAEDHLHLASLKHLYHDEGIVNVQNDVLPDYIRAMATTLQTTNTPTTNTTPQVFHIADQAESYLAKIRRQYPLRTERQKLASSTIRQEKVLEDQITQARRAVRHNERIHADINTNTKQDRTQLYLERSKGWRTDHQNVHDSAVMIALQGTVNDLADHDGEIVAPMDEAEPFAAAENYIETHAREFSEDVRTKAKHALRVVQGSNNIHAGMKFPENQIFRMVWRRSYHPTNAGPASNAIKEMVINNLSDMTQDLGNNNLSTVCASGRIGRTLSSLTYTDNDKLLGERGALTTDAIRNSVFDHTQELIKQKIDVALQSGIEEQQRFAQSYTDPSIQVSPDIEDAFKRDITNEVQQYMMSQYGDQLTPKTQASIMDHVAAGL